MTTYYRVVYRRPNGTTRRSAPMEWCAVMNEVRFQRMAFPWRWSRFERLERAPLLVERCYTV